MGSEQPSLWADVAAASRGDRAAYARLAHNIGHRLHAAALEELGKPQLAADATRRALIHVWRDLPSLLKPGQLDDFSIARLRRQTHEIRRQQPAEGTIVELGDAGALPMPSNYVDVALEEIATIRQRSGWRRVITYVDQVPPAARWALVGMPLAIALLALASITGVAPTSPIRRSDPAGDVAVQGEGPRTAAYPGIDITGVSVRARDALEVTLELAGAPATNRGTMRLASYALLIDVDLDGVADWVYTLHWQSGMYNPVLENVLTSTRRSMITVFDAGEGTSVRLSVPLDHLGDPGRLAVVVRSEGAAPDGFLFDQLPDGDDWIGPLVLHEGTDSSLPPARMVTADGFNPRFNIAVPPGATVSPEFNPAQNLSPLPADYFELRWDDRADPRGPSGGGPQGWISFVRFGIVRVDGCASNETVDLSGGNIRDVLAWLEGNGSLFLEDTYEARIAGNPAIVATLGMDSAFCPSLLLATDVAGEPLTIEYGPRRRWVLLQVEEQAIVVEVAGEDDDAFDHLWPLAASSLETVEFE